MDVQVQVAGQITSKPTQNGGTKFDIPLSNGMRASTFDVMLATKVSQLGGQPFTARIEQKPNPRGGAPYTNINAAAGPGEQLPPEIPQAGTPIGQQPAAPFIPQGVAPQGAPVTPTAIVPAESGGRGFSEADKVRITKLAVLGTAANLAAGLFQGAGAEALEDALSAVETTAKRLYTQARSHEEGAVPPQRQAAPVAETVPFEGGVPTDPQSVAAFATAEAGTPVVQVGVEGVQPAAEPAALPWS
jgi:hypothetical protein